MSDLKLGTRTVGSTHPTFIIAEIGINHQGDVEIAKELITKAKECGADAVKFQKRTIDLVYTQESLDAPRESPWGNTQRQQKEGLEFSKKEFEFGWPDFMYQLKK